MTAVLRRRRDQQTATTSTRGRARSASLVRANKAVLRRSPPRRPRATGNGHRNRTRPLPVSARVMIYRECVGRRRDSGAAKVVGHHDRHVIMARHPEEANGPMGMPGSSPTSPHLTSSHSSPHFTSPPALLSYCAIPLSRRVGATDRARLQHLRSELPKQLQHPSPLMPHAPDQMVAACRQWTVPGSRWMRLAFERDHARHPSP